MSPEPTLASSLDTLYRDFNREDSVSVPVHRVRPFADPRDREIAAFCAASLAFGRVASVLASIDRFFTIMGARPAQFVRNSTGAAHPELRSMVHRWTRGQDLVALLWILRQMLERSGSIEAFFLEGDPPASPDRLTRARQLLAPGARVRHPARLRPRAEAAGGLLFLSRPSTGSACKRLNLFLRWMVRKDEVDFGVWTRVPASRLIVPLDTHVIRLGRCLRLTRYTSPGWKMAADITASLRQLDPGDPVRFDFSICHVGMMNACGFGRRQGDSQCPLKGQCHPRPLRRGRRAR